MPRLLKRLDGAHPRIAPKNPNVSPASSAPKMLESLESRRLFSVINVNKFGAVPNDGRDDSAAVMSAFNAAAPGDTISFGAGTYNINQRIDVPGGLTIDGGKVATIMSARGDMAFHFASKGLTVQNINVDGGLVFIEGRGSLNPSNVTINWVNFTNIDQGADIGATRGPIGSPGARLNYFTLSNCDFEGTGSGLCFNAYTGDHWNIINNAFVHVLGAIKSNNVGNTANDININGNYFSLNRRHAVELQGSVNKFRFQGNYYVKPNISPDFVSNDSTFAFSLIYTATSTDQLISQNYIVVPAAAQEPDGLGPRLAFEAGEHAVVTDNYVIGCGTFATSYGPNSSVHDNKIKDQLYGEGYPYGPNSNTSTFYNNNWGATLSWDPATRPIPGPGGTYTGGSGGTIGYNPPPVTGSGNSPFLVGTVIDTTRILLNWTNVTGETGYRVERSFDDKTWTEADDTFLPDVLNYTDKSLPSGTIFFYRVVPYNAKGDMEPSNVIVAKTKGTAPAGSGSGSGPRTNVLAYTPNNTSMFSTSKSKTTSLDDDLFGKNLINL